MITRPRSRGRDYAALNGDKPRRPHQQKKNKSRATQTRPARGEGEGEGEGDDRLAEPQRAPARAERRRRGSAPRPALDATAPTSPRHLNIMANDAAVMPQSTTNPVTSSFDADVGVAASEESLSPPAEVAEEESLAIQHAETYVDVAPDPRHAGAGPRDPTVALERKRELNRETMRRQRAKLKATQDTKLYQLSKRGPDAPVWETFLTARGRERRKKKRGLVYKDAVAPPTPLPFDHVEPAAVAAANINASEAALKAVEAGRVLGLPYTLEFRLAAIIGQDDNNLTVRSSNGSTILQRFSPPNRPRYHQLQKDLTAGDPILKALFDAHPQPAVRHGAQSIHCGGWFNVGVQYGWCADHEDRRETADEALRWVSRFFHNNVMPCTPLLEQDFQEALALRTTGFERYKRLLGEDQCSLLHDFYTLAALIKSYTYEEHFDHRDLEPSALIGYGEPFVLMVVHREGFFKVIVRPGQVVFFRTHCYHQVHPLEKSSGAPRYALSLAMRESIAKADSTSTMVPRRFDDPPQPTEEDRRRQRPVRWTQSRKGRPPGESVALRGT